MQLVPWNKQKKDQNIIYKLKVLQFKLTEVNKYQTDSNTFSSQNYHYLTFFKVQFF